MFTTRLARTLSIPQAQWRAVTTTFLAQLGTPTQVVPPGADPVEADEVAWGRGATELRCLKEADSGFVPGGVEVFAGFQTQGDTELAFDLLSTQLKVKDELHPIYEYALVKGELKSRTILLGSFYLDQNTSALAESDTVGVIHNPDYPGKSAQAADSPCGEAAGPVGQALAYCLAGALSAVATAWLLRRRR